MCNLILHLYAHIWAHVHTWVHTCKNTFTIYAQALWLCWQVSACSTYSFYLLCCVMVGMCLAAASWQSKNGLLLTLPPSQPVAGLCLDHLKLLQAVAQLWCLIVEMRLAAASWQSKNCLLRYSRSKLRILIKMCCVVAVLWLEWAVSFQTPFHTVPYPFQTWTTHVPPLTHWWTHGRFSHRLLVSHPLRVGYGRVESCYAGTQSTP